MKMVSKVPKFRAIILVYDTRSTYSLKISDILPLYSPAISLRMRIGPVIIPVPVLEIHSVTYLPISVFARSQVCAKLGSSQ